jgi:hypothetical protein
VAAAGAVTEQVFFLWHFKLLKFQYYFHCHCPSPPFLSDKPIETANSCESQLFSWPQPRTNIKEKTEHPSLSDRELENVT